VRRERDGDGLPAVAGNRDSPVAAFQIEVLDVGAGSFGDPQPVQREQPDQRMLCRRPEPGGYQWRAELIAVEPGGYQWRAELVAVERGGVRLVVLPRTADVRGGSVLEEFLFDRVLIEPCDGAPPAGDSRAGPSPASSSVAKLSM
jgi:hypothetical protein